MRPEIEKMYIRLPKDRLEEIRALSDELGMSYTQFGGLLLWMGYKMYQRNVNPEKMFTSEQWVKFAELINTNEKIENDETTD